MIDGNFYRRCYYIVFSTEYTQSVISCMHIVPTYIVFLLRIRSQVTACVRTQCKCIVFIWKKRDIVFRIF